MSEIVITTLAERPEYLERMYEFADAWPEFMHNDPIGNAFMGQVPVRFPDQCVVATEDGELVAHGRSIPFVFPDENRTELPSGGWDRVLHWGFADLRNGREPNVSSALEILIRPSHLGRGLSHEMLRAMRTAVKAKGHSALFAPVRPNGKTDADQPMTEYIEQTAPRWSATRPVAAGARQGGRHHRQGGAPVDGDRGLTGGVARVDRPALRHDGRRDRPEGARTGALRRTA